MGTGFSFLGMFLGKCDNKGKEGFLCVKRTLKAGAKNALSANARKYAELLILSNTPSADLEMFLKLIEKVF